MTVALETKVSNATGTTGADATPVGGTGIAGRTGMESYGLPSRLPLAERRIAAQRVVQMEGRLFDGEGHQRSSLSEEAAGALLSEINDLRRDLGWLRLDRRHQPVWPEDIAS